MELKGSSSAHFLTLTYNDEEIPLTSENVPTLRKDDVQRFIKRLRRLLEGQGIRYYAVGEYGTRTSRPHYHVLVFNIEGDVYDVVHKTWGLGNIQIGTVTSASIHYVAKYHVNVIAPEDLNGRDPPFALMSRKPGIGARYFETHTEWHIYADRMYTQLDGFKRALPRYYRTKMFAERVVEIGAEWSEVKKYQDEIKRLEEYHDDPHAYYNEKRRYNHDVITHKSNEKNKL